MSLVTTRSASLLRTLAALAGAVVVAAALAACSASTSSLPVSAPTLTVTAGGAVATCSASTGEVVLTLDEPPVHVVENSGAAFPDAIDRIELSGTVTNLSPRTLYGIAVGTDATCPLVEVVRLEVYSDGPWRAPFDLVDGVRVFVVASDAISTSAFTCDAACVDAGTNTIFGATDSVIVYLE